MCNEDGTIWLTCNGEIYNFQTLREQLIGRGHRFRSRSDSEVILHAYEEWGSKCVEQLAGMFAFAIWDGRRRRLFLARDRLGIKPMYYAVSGNRVAFASQPMALIDLPFLRPEIASDALICYLVHGYVAGRQSIYQGIQRLLPGHTLLVDVETGQTSEEGYWSLDLSDNEMALDEAVQRLDSMLETVVEEHLVSEVPLATFLSGGIDSGCITAVAARRHGTLDSCTIGFDGSAADERHVARRTASLLGVRHHEQTVTMNGFSSLEAVFDFFDEPFANTSMFPMFLVCQQARQLATVVLSGDGGDEVFSGYEWYRLSEECRWLKRLAFAIGPVLNALGDGRSELARRCDRLEHFRRMSTPGFEIPELADLLDSRHCSSLPHRETYLYQQHWNRLTSPYKRWQYVDLKTFLVDSNLTTTDRASMAHGLEVRVPLLDHRIVEFAFGLSPRLIRHGGRSKALLRELLNRYGLDHLLHLPKRGFSCHVPSFWAASDMVQRLKGGPLVDARIVSSNGLTRFLAARHMHGWGLKLFLLTCLNEWCRRWYR